MRKIDVPKIIKRFLRRTGLTEKAAAKRLGISHSALNNYKNDTFSPTVELWNDMRDKINDMEEGAGK